MFIPSMALFLLLPIALPKPDIHCFSDTGAVKLQLCEAKLGYRTCFTKLDPDGRVATRGCSTKRPVFHEECENHVSGARKERFCYCSSHLCNSCPSLQPWGRAVGILALIALLPVVTGW